MTKVKGLVLGFILLLLVAGLAAQTQEYLWAKRAGGTQDCYSEASARDSYGNIYIAGTFSGTCSFGTQSLYGTDPTNDAFIAKLDSQGNCLWAISKGDYYADSYAQDIVIDSNDNVYFLYVRGYRPQNYTFYNFVVEKYDSEGNPIWTAQASTQNRIFCKSMCIDNFDNIYITGCFFGNASFGTIGLDNLGEEDVFVAKLSGSGEWLWAQQAGGTRGDQADSIVAGSDGSLSITGTFEGTAAFGQFPLTSTDGAYSDRDVYVAKLDNLGNWMWAVSVTGEGTEYSYDIALDSDNNPYVTGTFSGTTTFGGIVLTSYQNDNIFIAKLNSTGTWLWAKKGGGTSTDVAYGIALDNENNVYVTGKISENANFGSLFATTYGAFIASLNENGDFLRISPLPNPANATSNDITVVSKSEIYITGYFVGTSVFGNTSLVSSGGKDIFTAKYSFPEFQLLSPVGGEAWNSASTRTLYWTPTTIFGNVNIFLSIDNGVNWMSINSSPVSAALGRYTFVVPYFASTQCRIKIESIDYPESWFYTNTDPFTITMAVPPTVNLVFPSAQNLKLQTGSQYSLSWTYNQVSLINVQISHDSGASWTVIADNLPATQGAYEWIVPEITSTSCYIRVADSANSCVYDWSDYPFTICKLEIVSPPEGEIWVEATSKTITWESSNISNVKLQYSINGGSTWLTITNSISASIGSYNWIIPKHQSTQCKLRIIDTSDNSIHDESGTLFTIRPQILLTTPNGGELLLANSIHRILWDSTADVPQVLLDYSTNNGSTWLTLQGTPINAALGYYDWIVPNISTNQCRVKVKKSGATSIFDTSEATFSIVTQIIAPTAIFTADSVTGMDTLPVQFTDQSTPGTGTLVSWEWNFGDGSNSTQQHPSHTYLSPGVFTVSLTVTNTFGAFNTLERADYISVIQSVPEILLLGEPNINFGSVYVEENSEYQTISISNTGGVDLAITELHFISAQSSFEYQLPGRDLLITPGEESSILVRFSPQAVGTIIDTLFIINNSVNEPTLKIKLSGTGLYVPPRPPDNVNVTMNGNSAIITWDAVTLNLHDQPIAPDYYFVWFNGLDYVDAPYYFLAPVTESQYTHVGVSLGAEFMFYRVTAVKLYRDDLPKEYVNEMIRSVLVNGMSERHVREIITKLTGQSVVDSENKFIPIHVREEQ